MSKPAPSQQSPVSSSIREAVRSRGLSAYRVGQASGVSPRNVSRFLKGESDLSLASADRICVALGLKVVESTRRTSAPRPAPARPAAAPLPLPSVQDPEQTSESELIQISAPIESQGE